MLAHRFAFVVLALACACATGDEPEVPGPASLGDGGTSEGASSGGELSSGPADSGSTAATSMGDASADGTVTGPAETDGPVSDIGCADGTREGFPDPGTHPGIAACAGGWTEPGLGIAIVPECEHQGGNDTANPGGAGCSSADLCAAGWHVCETAVEVAARTDMGCTNLGGEGFFAMAQSGPGNEQCGEGANDLFGCGTIGAVIDSGSCTPIDRFSGPGCEDLPSTWNCGPDPAIEAQNVGKPDAADGGVLCCLDT